MLGVVVSIAGELKYCTCNYEVHVSVGFRLLALFVPTNLCTPRSLTVTETEREYM